MLGVVPGLGELLEAVTSNWQAMGHPYAYKAQGRDPMLPPTAGQTGIVVAKSGMGASKARSRVA